MAIGLLIIIGLSIWFIPRTFRSPGILTDESGRTQFLIPGSIDAATLTKSINDHTFAVQTSTILKQPITLSENDNWYGTYDPEHIPDTVIVEYSDLDCPYCHVMHPIIEKIVRDSNGSIGWVYRHFPLSIHPNAYPKAVATQCVKQVAGNDAFWNMVNVFMTTPQPTGSDTRDFIKGVISNQPGINVNKVMSCYDNPTDINALIDAQQQYGADIGITGTPGMVIVQTKK